MSETSKAVLDASSFDDVKTAVDKTYEIISSIWIDVYGENDSEKCLRVENLKSKFMEYCDDLIQTEENYKISLIKRIEEQFNKIKALQEELKIEDILDTNKIYKLPLTEIDSTIQDRVDEYEIIKKSRLDTLAKLELKESELCEMLNKPVHKLCLENGTVPLEKELNTYGNRIEMLEQDKASLINAFAALASELTVILKELQIEPVSQLELSLVNEDKDFPFSKTNFDILKNKLHHYQQIKSFNINETEELRKKLRRICMRIKQDPEKLESFLSERSGFTKTIIDDLKFELEKYLNMQNKIIKEVIINAREELQTFWDMCYISEIERNEFKAFKSDDYPEDILTMHDIEITKLEQKYNQYKDIYKLIEERKEIWDRLTELEEASKDPDRLFKNRGGQLLLEEKERKSLERDIIKLEKKLKVKIDTFEDIERKPFLYFGQDIKDVIQKDWDNKQASKENKKLLRKIAHLQTFKTESKFGMEAMKHKLSTSQEQLTRKVQKPNGSSKVNEPITPVTAEGRYVLATKIPQFGNRL